MEQMTLALNEAREKKNPEKNGRPMTAPTTRDSGRPVTAPTEKRGRPMTAPTGTGNGLPRRRAPRNDGARGGRTETVYRLVNRDKTKIGVVSHAPNCGYTDAELKSLAAKGWKIKVEVKAV